MLKETSFQTLKKISTADKIKVYTVQDLGVLNTLASKGVITPAKNKSLNVGEDSEIFKVPYKWMISKMKENIQDFSGNSPVWCWLEKPSAASIKKNFCENPVLITASVPVKRCLLSDFDSWHVVLNNGFIPASFEDWAAYNDGSRFQTQNDAIASWDNIFNLKKPSKKVIDTLYGGGDMTGFVVQVCVDQIFEDEILEIKTYDAL